MNYLVEMHIHTQVGSNDAFISIDQLVDNILNLKLNGVCIAEHAHFKSLSEEYWQKIYKSYYMLKDKLSGSGVNVYPGMELKINYDREYLVIGAVIPREVFDLPWEEAVKKIHELGGIIISSHPFRLHKNIGEVYDGIEIFDSCTSNESNNKARLVFKENNNLCCTIGGDAHYPDRLSRAIMVFDEKLDTDEKFVQAIKNNEFSGVIIDGEYIYKETLINKGYK